MNRWREGPPRKTGHPVKDQFAFNLWRERKRAGLSQEEVGYRSGLHRTEISLLETGSRTPRIDTVCKLAGALEIEPGRLLQGIRWQPGSISYGEFNLKAPEQEAGE